MRTLIIGDIHEPCSRRYYLQFCKDTYHRHNCDAVVFAGDLADFHAISFHAAHPEMPGPKDEFELAFEAIQKWYKAFRNGKVCIGNHDERVIRLAESVNIPKKFLRDFNDVWETPGWDWDYHHIIDHVYYFHGVGQSGTHPAWNAMKTMMMSVVIGHNHSAGGFKWLMNPEERYFGMDVGCGIDDKQMAFAYGKHAKKRSVISCGVVLDGIPQHIIMPISKGEQYYDDKENE